MLTTTLPIPFEALAWVLAIIVSAASLTGLFYAAKGARNVRLATTQDQALAGYAAEVDIAQRQIERLTQENEHLKETANQQQQAINVLNERVTNAAKVDLLIQSNAEAHKEIMVAVRALTQ